jgi:transcriptional regulator with XRE-family HTH domain
MKTTVWPEIPDSDVGALLGRNVRQLREARALTQAQVAKMADIPRATWANLETGAANPTLGVLHRVANALQVSIEELITTPRAACQFYPKGSLPSKVRNGNVTVRRLLPDVIPGMEMDRMDFPAGATLIGVPHTPGTREFLTCERGEIVLRAAGERWTLEAGDVLAFRGDQKHAYHNPGSRPAVGYSVVVLARLR